MVSKKLKIKINKPISEVFLFTLDPNNTPKWIAPIVIEKTNEWPPKIGTIYQNHGKDQVWSKYKIIKLIKNKMFELLKDDDNYHVPYSFESLGETSTEFEYYEWVKEGKLKDTFTSEVLEKLKAVIEK